MYLIILIIVSIFWAMNMGASGLAVSFAPSVGSGVIKKNKAVLFFSLFVLLGSLLVGINVAKTLGSKIIPSSLINPKVALIILSSSCVSLFFANILKIPQSTSIIIVSAFVGAGIYFRKLNIFLLGYMILVWILVSLFSYFITYFLGKKIYPPTHKNLRFYERLFYHEKKLKRWTLFTNSYSAFGIGANNVANVVGPLIASNIINPIFGFIIFSLFFGLGGLILGRGVLNTVSKEIVPLGFVSSSLVSLVVSTFIILCSIFGLPAPYVQFSTFSILAIHTLKEEKNHRETLNHPVTKDILKVWLITPFLSGFISYSLLSLFKIS